jgi:hypothetical protein
MLPWFISLLILLGQLQTPEQWNELTPAEQEELHIVVVDTIII